MDQGRSSNVQLTRIKQQPMKEATCVHQPPLAFGRHTEAVTTATMTRQATADTYCKSTRVRDRSATDSDHVHHALQSTMYWCNIYAPFRQCLHRSSDIFYSCNVCHPALQDQGNTKSDQHSGSENVRCTLGIARAATGC